MRQFEAGRRRSTDAEGDCTRAARARSASDPAHQRSSRTSGKGTADTACLGDERGRTDPTDSRQWSIGLAGCGASSPPGGGLMGTKEVLVNVHADATAEHGGVGVRQRTGTGAGRDYFFAAKKISLSRQCGRKPVSLLSAAKHNLREIQAELGASSHIDSARTHLNAVLRGPATAQAVVEFAAKLAREAGIDLARQRRDYCQAIELLFSLPAGADIDDVVYFSDCVAWTEQRFGAESVMSAVVHRDEGALHAHVFVNPIVDGRMRGGSLLSRQALADLRRSFEVVIARKFGLRMGQARITGASRGAIAKAVLERLDRSQDAATQSAVWPVIRAGIEAAPLQFAAALGVEAPAPVAKRQKSMTAIFIGAGRGPRVAREGDAGYESHSPSR
jgi:hypothetical protein